MTRARFFGPENHSRMKRESRFGKPQNAPGMVQEPSSVPKNRSGLVPRPTSEAKVEVGKTRKPLAVLKKGIGMILKPHLASENRLGSARTLILRSGEGRVNAEKQWRQKGMRICQPILGCRCFHGGHR
jgi:hypothetical protein